MHDKLKSANYKNYLSSGQIINIASRMLFELNPKLVEHNIRTAYIAFSIFQNYKMPEECTLQNLVVLSLFHTVGFYRPDFFGYSESSETLDLFSDEDIIKDKYVFGSFYLQCMTHLKRDAKALENFDKDYVPGESEKSYIVAYRELVYFSARMSSFYEENNYFPDDILGVAPNKFNPKIVSVFEKLNKDGVILSQLRTGNYKSYISNIINALEFSDEANQKMQKVLVYFLDFKSTSTFKHAINTACYALSLGVRAGLSEAELQVLYTSAILHDIGKISIPEKILETPKKLTDEEFLIMKTHVQYSKEIIQDYVSSEVVEAVYRHHEKLNGKGYPQGLSSKDLTPVQKIITVADILSALLDSRSYKHGYSKEQTFKILTEMTFEGEIDPWITEFVITDFDEILQELSLLQQDFKADYNVVVSKINDYVFMKQFKSDDSEDFVDDIEELEELEAAE